MQPVDVLARIGGEIAGTQPPPAASVVLATGVVALVLGRLPGAWRVTRHVVTIAHEGSHGVAALLSGRRLAGIRLHSDTSGLTLSRGRSRGPGMIATALAGYVGPGLLGLGAAYLLRERHALAVLWLAVLLLGAAAGADPQLLRALRRAGGGARACFAVSWWGSEPAQSAVAYAGTWFLLLAAPRPVVRAAAPATARPCP